MRKAPQRGLRLAKFQLLLFLLVCFRTSKPEDSRGDPAEAIRLRPGRTSPSASALPCRYDPERPELARGAKNGRNCRRSLEPPTLASEPPVV